MALPPYGYGGSTGAGMAGAAGSSNRDAMLRALQQQQQAADQYQYRPGANAQLPTGRGGAIADAAASALPDLSKQLGSRAASSATATPATLPGAPSVAPSGITGLGHMSPGTAMGVGLATELGGALLKPKGQAATESPYADLTDQYRRREEGSGDGIAGGAVKWGGRGAQLGNVVPGVGTAIGAGVGALAGAVGGAFTKNAASAYSDFSREDAVNAIKEMYATRGGRLPTAQEVEQILVGAGTKRGDKWVGEKGLYSILSSLDSNFAKEQLAAGGGAADGGSARVYAPEDPRAGGAGNQGAQGINPGDVKTPADIGAASQADTSTWDTDGYAVPQYTAQTFGKVMPGFDRAKWNDPNHQTPKYVVGRILSNFEPRTENVDAAVAEIAKAFPGARRTGSGDVTIPGVGTMDILVGADVGGKRWHAGSANKGGGKAQASASGASDDRALTGGYDASGDMADGGTLARIMAEISKYAGTGQGVGSARNAVLNQLV